MSAYALSLAAKPKVWLVSDSPSCDALRNHVCRDVKRCHQHDGSFFCNDRQLALSAQTRLMVQTSVSADMLLAVSHPMRTKLRQGRKVLKLHLRDMLLCFGAFGTIRKVTCQSQKTGSKSAKLLRTSPKFA